MKKSLCLAAVAAVMLTGISCKKNEPNPGKPDTNKTIVVLYENDVHCGVSGQGYAKIAGLSKAINQSDTACCVIVSSGDFLQGGSWGALSKGSYIVSLMNAVGYSAVTIGNHEFDYGTQQLLDLLGQLKMPQTCVNFSPAGSSEQYLKPYVLTEVSGKKIAFVGVVTPETLKSEFYAIYDKDGKPLCDLYPSTYITLTQQAVDAARTAGADYVILLSHLGEKDNGYSSIDLIGKTSGIDVVLDGHTHSVIADSTVLNSKGQPVSFTQTGTEFANIGKLTISTTGKMRTQLINTADITYTDPRVVAIQDSISQLVEGITGKELGSSDHELSINDASGTRIVRNHETTIGNFVADAYRYCLQAELGLANGGGIRASLPAGTITYGMMMNIHPFFNDMEIRSVTGSQLRTALAESYKKLPKENGGFLHVSGLKVQIDMQSGSAVVTDIQVEQNGSYGPLDDSRTYMVAATSYIFTLYSCLSDCKTVRPVVLKDAETLRQYFVESLKGNMTGRYTGMEDRIVIQGK